MKWVRWSQWDNGGMVGFGQMPVQDVEKDLQKFEQEASIILKKTGADHVVYGLKVYDDEGELAAVKFYLKPMNDEDFQKDVASLKDVVVYALHKR